MRGPSSLAFQYVTHAGKGAAARSNTRTMPNELATRYRPFCGLNPSPLIHIGNPSRRCTVFPVATLHTRTVLSPDPTAIRSPSGENCPVQFCPLVPKSVWMSSPVEEFQRRTVWSHEELAMILPSGLSPTHMMASV